MPRKFTPAQERMLLRLLRVSKGVRKSKHEDGPEKKTLESLVRKELVFTLPDVAGFSPGRIVSVYQLTTQGRTAAEDLLAKQTAA